MLRHLQHASLQNAAVIGSFLLTLTVFTVVFLRALRMKKEEVHRLGHLPLQDDNDPPSRHD